MAYNDNFLHFPTSTGTATASATTGVNVTAQLGDLLRPVNISQLRVVCLAAPAAGVTGLGFTVMQGTNTIGTVALGTNSAAGNGIDIPVTNGNLTGRSPLSLVVTGTATASGGSIGTFMLEGE